MGSKMTKKTAESTSKKNAVKPMVKQKKRYPRYISFGRRVTFNILFFLVFLIGCFFVATKTIEREKTQPINYSDVNQISYKVYLKPNSFYKEKYLEMNRAYVASLIDYIVINYNYLFNIEKLTNMDFSYRIIAELIIENNKGTSFVDEKYVIRDNVNKRLENDGMFNIDERVTIDYGFYNTLANKFKVETGVDINGYLNVYLEVDKKTDETLNYKIAESTKSNIKIPLSERALEINFDSNNGGAKKQVFPLGKVTFNPTYLAIEIILFIITAYFFVKIMKYLSTLISVKTPYDKFIKKILKDYDRLIVETRTDFNMTNYNVITVNKFSELLDVRDNLKLPIIYYNIKKHEKGIFYIKNNTDVYIYVVKNIDLKK